MGRLRQHLKELKQEYGYDTQTFYIVPTEKLAQLLKDMGDMPESRLIKTSDLPKVTRTTSSGGRAGQTEVDYYNRENDCIDSRRIDMRQERNCVFILKNKNNYDMGCGTTKFGISGPKAILKCLYNLGILGEDQTVYFLTPSKARQRKVFDNPHWTSIGDYTVLARTAVQEKGQNISVMLDAQDFQESSRVCELMEELGWQPTGEIGEIAQALFDTKVCEETINEFKFLQQSFRGFLGARGGWPTEYGKPRIDLDKMLEDKAPMLKFAPRWFRNDDDKARVLNYLKKEVDKE